MIMDTNILEKIGLTKGEIRIYYALLELGSTTTGPIILKSKVARSKSYEILERLKEKGLVAEAIRENVRYFQAAPPERILDYIEEKKKNIESEAEEFKKTLPLLKERQKSVSLQQEVKMYLGFEGVRTFYMEILNRLKEKDEYLALTFSEK